MTTAPTMPAFAQDSNAVAGFSAPICWASVAFATTYRIDSKLYAPILHRDSRRDTRRRGDRSADELRVLPRRALTTWTARAGLGPAGQLALDGGQPEGGRRQAINALRVVFRLNHVVQQPELFSHAQKPFNPITVRFFAW